MAELELDVVLLVEDDPEVAAAVGDLLQQLGLTVQHVSDGKVGLERALAEHFRLIVLDIRLPSLDGLEICKRVRLAKPDQAILMLTGESDEVSTVLGLELGADEYIAKPFRAKELRARVSALLRRYQVTASVLRGDASGAVVDGVVRGVVHGGADSTELPQLRSGPLRVDELLQAAFVGEERVPLTPTEYRLLITLMSSRNRTFTPDQLAQSVLGYDWHSDAGSPVRAHVSRLRRKLEAAGLPDCIVSEKGFGYRFKEIESPTEGDFSA